MLRTALLGAALIGLVMGCGSPAPPPPPPPTPIVDVPAVLLRAINASRTAAKLPPLRLDARLVGSASAHAARMARTGKMAHEGIGDGDPWSRMAAAGYPGGNGGEVLAQGQRDAEEAVADWMADPPHRADVLGRWTDMGGAMVDGYWCADFGRPSP